MTSPLAAPLKVGPLSLRNRVVMLPTGLQYAVDGRPTARDAAFYGARARGGVACVITGGTIAHSSSTRAGRTLFEAFRPEYVPDFARVADAVHAHGALIVGQILHLGRELRSDAGDAESPPFAPSALRSPGNPQVPRPMGLADIDDVVAGFTASAANLAAAGYDGVELHAAHGYLLGQFLSPAANRRTDGYGGDVAGRARMLLETAAAVRHAIGPDRALGVRISVDEQIAGGMVPEQAVELVELLGRAQLFDYLSIAIGVRGAYVKDMSHDHALTGPAAALLRPHWPRPLLVSQRIVTPRDAESLLTAGNADLIGVARALIADPDWTAKALGGRAGRILPCVGCLQLCRGSIGQGGVGCVHNAETGREDAWAPLTRSAAVRRVLVVGGGPAGLEAARIAADRGHEVTVMERAAHLGGQVRQAAAAPGRAELAGVVDFRESELRRMGVRVLLGAEATARSIAAEQPDVVVLATGSVPSPLAGTRSVDDVLPLPHAELRAARTAVVVDDGSAFWETVSTVEALAANGTAVTVITPAVHAGAAVPAESKPPLRSRLAAAGVVQFTQAIVRGTGPTWVEFDGADGVARRVDADVVVSTGPRTVADGLAAELAGLGIECVAIGDCLAPRRIQHAVLDGHVAARNL